MRNKATVSRYKITVACVHMSGRSDPRSLIEACPNLTGNVQLVKTDFVSCDVFLLPF